MAQSQRDQRHRTPHQGWWLLSASLVVAGTLHLYAEEPVAEEPITPPPIVQDEMGVGIEYTLTVEGAVVDSTEGRGAFHYVQGRQQIISGLERRLAGLQVGDRRYVVITPEDGYGEIDPEAFIEVPVSQLPTDISPEVGMVINGVDPDGRSFQGRVSEIRPGTVTLDLNHPLAGKLLNFAVTVVEISPSPTPEAAPTLASVPAPLP